MRNYQINLVFNTSNDDSAIDDAVLVRRTAMLQKIPYYTTVAAINATSIAIEAIIENKLTVRSIQEFYKLLA